MFSSHLVHTLGQGQVEQVSEGSNNGYTCSIREEIGSGPEALEGGRRDIKPKPQIQYRESPEGRMIGRMGKYMGRTQLELSKN